MGAPSEAGDATWFHTSYPDAFWATPGGDFQRTESGLVLIDPNGSYTCTGDGTAVDRGESAFAWTLRWRCEFTGFRTTSHALCILE